MEQPKTELNPDHRSHCGSELDLPPPESPLPRTMASRALRLAQGTGEARVTTTSPDSRSAQRDAQIDIPAQLITALNILTSPDPANVKSTRLTGRARRDKKKLVEERLKDQDYSSGQKQMIMTYELDGDDAFTILRAPEGPLSIN